MNTAPLEHAAFTSANTEVLEDVMAPMLGRDQHWGQLSDIAWQMGGFNSQQPNVAMGFSFDDQGSLSADLRGTSVEECVDATRLSFEPGDDYITTGTIYNERVRFASRQFRNYPEMFYRRGQAPFIHGQMYTEQTPQVIQDALSSCALYCGKNSENELSVFGNISTKARDLVNLQVSSMSPYDLLAATQALLLHQITRLFDGDIRQRADAEADETTLISWTEKLLAQTKQISSIMESRSSSVDCLTISSWNDWIFEESCRRTILTSYLLQGVYSFLKSGYDTVSGKVDKLSFTAQAALWKASSEFHWKEALAHKRQFQVIVHEWDTAMDGSTPDDIEELGLMVMACLKGMEATCEWLGKDHLQRWGLEQGTA